MTRWSTWAAVAVAAAAIGACSDRKETAQGQQASDGGSASMQRAEQQSEKAAEAHERAADEQKALADAQKEAREAQEEARKARQEVQEKSASAQQATDAARQQTTEATTERAQAQQEAEQQRQKLAQQEQQQTDQQQAQAQAPSPAQQPVAEGERTVNGSVVRATPDELVLRQEGGLPDLRLKVDGGTPVMLDGRQASVADLREGTQVRASFDEANGEPRATRIEAHGGAGGGTGTQAR
jgi:hypothetical protein